jgi:hypothetical protein
MSVWDTYPPDYRAREVAAIVGAVLAGECVSVVGLSGAGKSNLLGFLANRVGAQAVDPGAAETTPACPCRFILADCNRLSEATPEALLRLARQALGDSDPVGDDLQALDATVGCSLAIPPGRLCLLFDRFDSLMSRGEANAQRDIASNLRALRDAHKYSLTFVTATRRPLDPHTELAELFYANTLWLGPLSENDARWNIERYTGRKGLKWDAATTRSLIELSWGYPSLLRAVCEAAASGAGLGIESFLAHPAVIRRIEEFWADKPDEEQIRLSGLEGQPLLAGGRPGQSSAGRGEVAAFDTTRLTAKEHLLLEMLRRHPGEVCEKDSLIRAVWPEDKIFEQGIRDDSLAQLVRRLREKIEPDPSAPRFVHTVPGRGYRFTP